MSYRGVEPFGMTVIHGSGRETKGYGYIVELSHIHIGRSEGDQRWKCLCPWAIIHTVLEHRKLKGNLGAMIGQSLLQ